MPAPGPDTRAHLEWLGFLQPNGLVVSAPALAKAGAILNRQDPEGWSRLLGCIREREIDPARGPEPCIPDFRGFAAAVLGWGFSPRGYAGTEEAPVPAALEAPLPDYGEALRPDFAVRERDPRDGRPPWQLLVQVLEPGQDFDAPATASSRASSPGSRAAAASGAPSRTGADAGASGSPGGNTGVGGAAGPRRLDASPQSRAERLLRSTGVPAGLLFNGVALRLISAPRGESSGWMDFRVADMCLTAGRPLCSALRLLLSEQRLLALPRGQRLAALLEDSRKYQNEVSERLAEQVLHALYELLRGLQAAHDASGGDLLREPLAEDGDRDDVYRALLSVILRLVFLLYAEERGALPEDDVFLRHYSLTGLYERLREDAALHPDTMDQRFGAWAQLLVLFRLIHDGAPAHRTGGALTLPERLGALFDPDRFPFLEGRYERAGVRQTTERVRPPLVSDGAVYRVLEKLLVLDGERISYRTLDVEQIGSVYQTIMGFRMEVAAGRSVAVRSAKKLGAPNVVDLDALLAEPKEKDGRARWLQARADRNVTDTVAKALRAAETVDDLHAALDRVLDKDAAPDLVPPGALVLQPNEERRRSGSHYTPRELTEPIVRHTLAPLLDRLRGDGHHRAPPTPAQILDLKVCDPSMGSGAFLVETCRQLADALIEAWGAHGEMPAIPPDEDEVIFARRLVAQRCLYGIDRNPMAVDLAKVSLWLSTLARDHPLTFVDHAFRHGDSLIGLTRRQIEALDWAANAPRSPQRDFEALRVGERMAEVAGLRQRIREAGEEVSDRELHDLWRDAHDGLDPVRLSGDLVLAAFFAETKPKPREARRRELAKAVLDGEAIRYLSWLEELRRGNPPLAPFHWEIEFPEVFGRENPGFDAFVGNPPFAGKNAVAAGNVPGYPDWLKAMHEGSHGNADLVAHFWRRAFDLVRRGGAIGLIATNTIAQGDTRTSGLRWICEHGGEIYRATRRVKWPGEAAVVVSVLHVAKGGYGGDAGGGGRAPDGADGGGANLDAHHPAHPRQPAAETNPNPDRRPVAPRIAGAAARSNPYPYPYPYRDTPRSQREMALDAEGRVLDDPHPPAYGARPEGGDAGEAGGGNRVPDGTDGGGANLDAYRPGHPRRAWPEGRDAGDRVLDDPHPAAYGDWPEDGNVGDKVLDGQVVETITAFLFHRGGHADPARLAANAGKSFVGSYILGMGFTFDDTDRKGVASPLAEMRRLIEDDPRNREAIFPYIGGEEVNTSPTHAHHRYVINFRDWPLRRENIGESREDGGESRSDADAERSPHPRHREGVGESRADANDERELRPGRVEGSRADAERQHPLRQEDSGESEGVGEAWTDAGDRRRRYPSHREAGAESWMDADEERRRELRRQPIVPHDYPEPVAADWPELLAIVEERVKPGRAHLTKNAVGQKRATFWWQYGSLAKELYAAVTGLERVLAISRIGQHAAFAFLPRGMVYAESMIIFPLTTHAAFCALQSRPHELWARFFGSSMKDDLRYTPSDCFETFPFPEGWETHPALEAAGRAYHDFRAALMVENGEGLTKTCNRFHDPDETGPDIAELRALHAAMDRAVLDAYGWRAVPTGCDFLLDHEIDEAAWGRKKRPYRYRWPDPTRDEVLARLLALNADRAAAEARTNPVAVGPRAASHYTHADESV